MCGEISGPAGHGVHTLRLEHLDLARCRIDERGEALLVDRQGSELRLSRLDLHPEEIREALAIFGLDPDPLGRVAIHP